MFAGETMTMFARFRTGIDSLAAPELNVPMYAIASGSFTARLAFSASLPASQPPLVGVASSSGSKTTLRSPALPPRSSIAMQIALTIVCVCASELPVIGKLE